MESLSPTSAMKTEEEKNMEIQSQFRGIFIRTIFVRANIVLHLAPENEPK